MDFIPTIHKAEFDEVLGSVVQLNLQLLFFK